MVKRIATLTLALVLASASPTYAKTKTLHDPIEYTLTEANKSERYIADVDEDGYLRLHLEVNKSCDFSVFVRQDSQPTYGKNYEKSDWLRDDKNKCYYDMYCPVVKGTASIDVKIKADTEYKLKVVWADTPTDPKHYISDTSLKIATGYKKKIRAGKKYEKIIWSSNNKKIATVKDGLIKAKSPGITHIVATFSDGTSLKCRVKVVNNTYMRKAISPADVDYGASGTKVYHAQYDKEGNLIITFRVINRDGRPIRRLRGDITCTLNDTVVAETTFDFDTNIKYGRHVDYSIIIKKKDVKKVVNLTKATFKISNASFSY